MDGDSSRVINMDVYIRTRTHVCPSGTLRTDVTQSVSCGWMCNSGRIRKQEVYTHVRMRAVGNSDSSRV